MEKSIKRNRKLGWGILAAVLFVQIHAGAQSRGRQWSEGDMVDNFTLTDRITGEEVQLHDFENKIVMLEWFTWW